jgi:hypothetical protein
MDCGENEKIRRTYWWQGDPINRRTIFINKESRLKMDLGETGWGFNN